MESNVCKKPASAGVCAAQRQIFGPLRGPKIETLGRLSEKSMDFFDSLTAPSFQTEPFYRWDRRVQFCRASRFFQLTNPYRSLNRKME